MNEKHLFWGLAAIAVLLLPGCRFGDSKIQKITPIPLPSPISASSSFENQAEIIKSEPRMDEGFVSDAQMVYFVRDFTNGHTMKTFRPSIDKAETVVLKSNSFYDVMDVYKPENKGIVFLQKNDNNKSELRQISLKTGEEKTLLELENWSIGGAKFSPDGQKIAYMTQSFDEKTAELFLYDLKTGKSSKISDSFQVPMLSAPRPLAFVNDSLIVKLIGGDAGAVWGETYRVNISSGKREVVKLSPIGKVSPDQTKFLSTVCFDAPAVDMEWPRSCKSGEEIQVTDLINGTTQTLYKNLTHDDNTMKGLVRTIFDYDWTEEGNVVFRIADGFYEMTLKEKKLTEIRSFYWTDPQVVGKSMVNILFADKEYLAWSQSDDSFSAAFILNRDTGKAIMLPNVDNNQTVISEMEKIR